MQKYPMPLSNLISTKIDRIIMKNMAYKCRGFLQRLSLVHKNKWQKCFYCIDMDEFTSVKGRKVLNSYALKENYFQEKLTKMRHLKRIRLDEEVQMLALPRYEKKMVKVKKIDPKVSNKRMIEVIEEKIELVDFLAVVYKNEDKVLTDIVYQFKEHREYPPNI